MAIDLSQFHQIFFDEAGEHLASMEAQLLGLDLARPDEESINAIFRAAHSIKGSAATFGFDDMTALTHELEGLLDLVRKGRLPLDQHIVDASLAAGDLLKLQLAALQGGAPADAAAAAAVREELVRLAAGGTARAAPPPAVAPAAPAAPVQPVAAGSGGRLVSFEPEVHCSWDRRRIDTVLEELRDLGPVQVLRQPDAGLGPGLWQLQVELPVSDEELRDILEYVAQVDSVRIEPVAAPADEAPPAAPPPDAPADAGAELLERDEGLVARDGSFGLFRPLPAAQERTAAARSDVSIRVSVDKVDQLMNLVGELVITQSMLLDIAGSLAPAAAERMLDGLAHLERHTRDLQDSVMAIRMLPISVAFGRFPRVVHDLCQQLGKQAELQVSGGHTELDKGLIELIVDPLTHLIRNAMDHGLEAPAARRAAGKPECGTLQLRASHQGGSIVIEVEDDGAGLDRERILAKARERGLPVAEGISDAEVWQLVFAPGFSTADVVTDISGRGVGMDVVKRNIAALGGSIDIHSRRHQGTRVTVRLPLTLAILEAMSVRIGGEIYVLALNFICESLLAEPAMVRSVAGVPRLLEVRGSYLPVLVLADFFGIEEGRRDWCSGVMVVVEAGGQRAALLVDELLDQQQVVIKSFEANLRRVDGVSGATILGDGRVALILDVGVLAACAHEGFAETTR